ncbi:alpha/beta hydrolase [Phytopseudomonas daroniae]|nr:MULTISPECIES: alpha/beta hydrolase [Pseudomonas]
MLRSLCCLCLMALLCAGPAFARPDLSEPLEPTVADRGSAFYRFETLEMASLDGQRQYRIWIATPKRAAPASGYPVIYLLDGNAALGALEEQQLADLDERGPPLLVFVGYATELRFDVTARAYDYTPPLPGGKPVIDDLARERRGGGAELFLDLLQQKIKPQVEARAPIDPQRQSLWGHSYGGLLALHCLFTRPQAFQNYIVADPSIWWQDGFILDEEKAFSAPAEAVRLVLLRGLGERPRAKDDAATAARRKAVAAVPEDAAARMAERLAAYPGMQVSYREFADLSHGPMLPVSLFEALRSAAGAVPNDNDNKDTADGR